ncbi:MAG: signal peptidase I [Clostridia bacterium]|nr:signal peptidase I [Clostridia bacterium]
MNQEPLSTETPESNPIPAPTPESFGSKLASTLFDAMEMFALAVFAVVLIFTFGFRLCRVDGESMENTLYNGEMLLISSIAYTPKQDDVIVFHMTKPEVGLEKPLVKRVVATGGQKVVINFRKCEITVDGVKYEDSHMILKDINDREIGYYYNTADHHYDPTTGIFSAVVPEGCVFVLGDNRNNSRDGRDTDVGFIDERVILGKVILRFSPFTIFS